jgi:hypothetical protein
MGWGGTVQVEKWKGKWSGEGRGEKPRKSRDKAKS